MRPIIRFPLLALSLAVTGLSGCESNIDFRGPKGPHVTNTRSVANLGDGGFDFGLGGSLPPPPGRTPSQRAERENYYMGPRGSEW